MPSISFAYPIVLLLLVIPCGLLAWIWRRSGNEIAVPLDRGIQSSGNYWKLAIQCFESTAPLVLAVAIILLAGPQKTGQPKTRRALTNIEFCVDVSGSMTASFGNETRYEASMKAIQEFVDYRDGDAFGLTFFSDAVLNWVPLTTDASAIKYSLPFMDPRRPLPEGLGGGTQIAKALEDCRRTLLQREEGDRMIILVSDGASADLYNGRDAEIGNQLKKDGITLFDIHVADGEVPNEIVNLAFYTDGEVFQPGDKQALADVFMRIDKMQKAKLIKVAAETQDNLVPFAIAGLSFLGIAVLGSFGMRYTPW